MEFEDVRFWGHVALGVEDCGAGWWALIESGDCGGAAVLTSTGSRALKSSPLQAVESQEGLSILVL
jgi:hypothetical protein